MSCVQHLKVTFRWIIHFLKLEVVIKQHHRWSNWNNPSAPRWFFSPWSSFIIRLQTQRSLPFHPRKMFFFPPSKERCMELVTALFWVDQRRQMGLCGTQSHVGQPRMRRDRREPPMSEHTAPRCTPSFLTLSCVFFPGCTLPARRSRKVPPKNPLP